MKKIALYGLPVLAWLVFVAAALEVADRVWWRWAISSSHLSAPDETSAWKYVSPEKGGAVDVGDTVCPGGRQSPASGPETPARYPVPPDDLQTRVARFMALTDDEKATFDVIGWHGYYADARGVIQRTYLVATPLFGKRSQDRFIGKSITDTLGPDSLAAMQRALREGKPEQAIFPDKSGQTSGSLDVTLAPDADGKGVYLFGYPRQDLPADTMWLIPFYKYKPNAASGDGQMRTNNCGLRGDDIELPKPASTYRILCLGESTTLEGNAFADSYPGLVQARLRKCFGDRKRIEVINGGIPGTYAHMIRARLQDYLALQPDLVILYIGINDDYQNRLPEWKRAMKPWQRTLLSSGFLRHQFNGLFLPSSGAMRARIRETMTEDFKIIREYTRKNGIDLAICSIAYPSRLSWKERAQYEYLTARFNANWTGDTFAFAGYCRTMDAINDCARAYCAESGCLYVPVWEEIKGGHEYFADICHMWLKGRQSKSRIVFDHIKDLVAERVAVR